MIVGDALFGEDDYARSLRAQAARLGIADRVIFLGHRADVPALDAGHGMQSCIPRSIPSRSAVPWLKACSAGLWSLHRLVAASRDILDDGRAGLLVPPGDAPSLADALAQLKTGMPGQGALVARASARGVANITGRPK